MSDDFTCKINLNKMNNEAAEQSEKLDIFEQDSRQLDQQVSSQSFPEDIKTRISRWDVCSKDITVEKGHVSSTNSQILQDSGSTESLVERNELPNTKGLNLQGSFELEASTEESETEKSTSENVNISPSKGGITTDIDSKSNNNIIENRVISHSSGESNMESDSNSIDEIIDSEVSNIIAKSMPESQKEQNQEFHHLQKIENNIAGYLSNGDSMGIDLENSTLSPCFPLIRDREKLSMEIKAKDERSETTVESEECEISEKKPSDIDTEFNRSDHDHDNDDDDDDDDDDDTVKVREQAVKSDQLTAVINEQSDENLDCNRPDCDHDDDHNDEYDNAAMFADETSTEHQGTEVSTESNSSNTFVQEPSDIINRPGDYHGDDNDNDDYHDYDDHDDDSTNLAEQASTKKQEAEVAIGSCDLDFPVEEQLEQTDAKFNRIDSHYDDNDDPDAKHNRHDCSSDLDNDNTANVIEQTMSEKKTTEVVTDSNELDTAIEERLCTVTEDYLPDNGDDGNSDEVSKVKEQEINELSSTTKPIDYALTDSVNIVSSSIDSGKLDDFRISDLDKDLHETSCETTSEQLANFDTGETNADITSADVSGDTSGEFSGDVSYISSIDDEDENEPAQYELTTENIYLINKKKSRMHKEVRRMKCDCSYEPDEPGFVGCGAGCMNRLLMIECGSKCSCGEFCTNKNFQKGCRYNLEVFRAGKKGWGLRTLERIEEGVFIIEYCGEVVNYSEFMKRTETYDQERRKHYYFMTLKANEIIDATRCGSISRFINHSCDPNCVTQKWTVNGFLRVGFFSLREIKAGEELCFDYQYQRYGEKAQKCLCGTAKCRGVIGELKQVPLKNTPTSCDSPKRKPKKKNTSEYTAGFTFGEEIGAILGEDQKIVTANQALSLTRLMVTASGLEDRRNFLRILRELSETKALKAFIKYNGLSLLWSWMVEATCDTSFKVEILTILKLLPIPNKNHLAESKLLPLVEKLSNCQDSQDTGSTRSDEEGSSNSDIDNNEATEVDAKDAIASSSEKPKADKVEKCMDPKDVTPDADKNSTDEDSDNLERNEEIISLASELLDRWKLLREVFKIPKKTTPLTPDQPKQGSEFDACASPADDSKRYGKRKFENNSPSSLFSPKRQFSSVVALNSNSPIKPLMESPTHSYLRESPSTSSSSPFSSKGINESESQLQNEDNDVMFNRMTVMKARPEETGIGGDLAKRNLDSRYPNDEFFDSRMHRNRGRFTRGNLSWRNNCQQYQDGMQSGRGARGGRGRARGRMRGNFAPSGYQQNDSTMQHLPGNRPKMQPQEFQQNQSREFRNRNFPVSGTNQLNDMNRLGSSSYNYQALGQDAYQNRPNEFQPLNKIHSERQHNIDSTFRNPGYDVQYGRPPQQYWPAASLANQPPQGFTAARMPSMVSQQPPAPSQQYVGMQAMTQQTQNVPLPNFQHWNANSPGAGLVAPSIRSQEMDSPGGMNRPPSMPVVNQPQPNPYVYQQPRMQNQTVEQQQQPNTYFDSQRENSYGQQQQQQQQVVSSLSASVNQCTPTPSSIMKHLHEMVQQSKVSVATDQHQQQQNQQLQQPYAMNTQTNRTPEMHGRNMNIETPAKDHKGPEAESPSSGKPVSSLPPNWKTATDPEGKIYYYHVISRKTQWEMPKWEDDSSQARPTNVSTVASIPGPHTPPASPPHSPISPAMYNTRPPAISDPAVSTTRMSNASTSSSELTPKQQKIRDNFKMKLSGVVVNCLNPYQKVDCKHARIAKVEDFKFLARKLTHGLMMKELARNRPDEELECNDSVKIKVKEYIRNYMKKYGEFYIRS